MMNITDVKVRLSPKNPNPYYIGIASITIDNELVINDIKIYRSKYSSEYKIRFPNNAITERHGKKNIVPLSADIWSQITKSIAEKVEQIKKYPPSH